MIERFPSPVSKEDKESSEDTLRWIANKISNEKGIASVEEYILGGNIEKAQEYLLGSTDRLFEEGRLNFDQAAELYKLIGVSPERMARLRHKQYLQ
ncbi:MAG: hypothetical protein ACYC48_02815 [Minisyncoccota bacterium]